MDKLDKIIKENMDGEIFYDGWIKCKHIQKGLTHCEECLRLDKCWFYSSKSPKLPHHNHCHCNYEMISSPKTSDCKAECPIGKIKDYIFGEDQEDKSKRRIFEILGFTVKDSEYICREYERQALEAYVNGNYKLGKLDWKGQRITIDIFLERNGRGYYKGSGWMVRPDGLITNNTPIANANNKELEKKYRNENKQYS